MLFAALFVLGLATAGAGAALWARPVQYREECVSPECRATVLAVNEGLAKGSRTAGAAVAGVGLFVAVLAAVGVALCRPSTEETPTPPGPGGE